MRRESAKGVSVSVSVFVRRERSLRRVEKKNAVTRRTVMSGLRARSFDAKTDLARARFRPSLRLFDGRHRGMRRTVGWWMGARTHRDHRVQIVLELGARKPRSVGTERIRSLLSCFERCWYCPGAPRCCSRGVSAPLSGRDTTR